MKLNILNLNIIWWILVSLVSFSNHSSASQDFFIIANGTYEHEVVQSLILNKTVIALDGAANKLRDVIPDYILGDFDSITPETKEKYQKMQVQFIEVEDQNFTDLEKAIMFAKEKGARAIFVCCALGGERTDHLIGNLSILKKYYDKNCRIIFHTPKEILYFLKNETFSFRGNSGAQCAFLGWPKAVVSTSGLIWDVKDWETEIGDQISTCNKLNEEYVEIKVKGDLLLICPK